MRFLSIAVAAVIVCFAGWVMLQGYRLTPPDDLDALIRVIQTDPEESHADPEDR